MPDKKCTDSIHNSATMFKYLVAQREAKNGKISIKMNLKIVE